MFPRHCACQLTQCSDKNTPMQYRVQIANNSMLMYVLADYVMLISEGGSQNDMVYIYCLPFGVFFFKEFCCSDGKGSSQSKAPNLGKIDFSIENGIPKNSTQGYTDGWVLQGRI